MIKVDKRMLMRTAAAFLDEFGQFAHTYAQYCLEQRRVNKYYMESDPSSAYSKRLTQKTNLAAAKLFHLNSLAVRAFGHGFIIADHPIVSEEDKADLINEAYSTLTYE